MNEPRTPTLAVPHLPGALPSPLTALFLNPYWLLAPCKRRGSKINLQCPLCHTGSGQAWLCPAAAMPGPKLTPSAARGLPGCQPRGPHPGPGLALTLLRRRPPLWCSGVLVSDALLVFSLLLLGSLSLIMSYWRQKRAMTPAGDKGEQSEARAPVLAPPLHAH